MASFCTRFCVVTPDKTSAFCTKNRSGAITAFWGLLQSWVKSWFLLNFLHLALEKNIAFDIETFRDHNNTPELLYQLAGQQLEEFSKKIWKNVPSKSVCPTLSKHEMDGNVLERKIPWIMVQCKTRMGKWMMAVKICLPSVWEQGLIAVFWQPSSVKG